MKYRIFATMILFSACQQAIGQGSKTTIGRPGHDPVFIVDSMRIAKDDLKNYSPEQISTISVFKGTTAIALLGEEGKDGVVYIETKGFAKKRYWRFFSNKSNEYKELIPNEKADTIAQYILNGKILNKNFESNLAALNNSTFKKITIMFKEELQKQFGIENKAFGVLISSGVPDSLNHGKK